MTDQPDRSLRAIAGERRQLINRSYRLLGSSAEAVSSNRNGWNR